MFVRVSLSGALLAVARGSWFGVWVGLELNLLAFLPVVIVGRRSVSVEAGLKYFLVQACGSLVVLQAGAVLSSLGVVFTRVLVLALTLKSGGAPCHFWLPIVSEGLRWGKVGLLFRVQKLAPLTLLFYRHSPEVAGIYGLIVMASAVVGTVGGINELSLRKLLAFSSISHFGWLCLGMERKAEV